MRSLSTLNTVLAVIAAVLVTYFAAQRIAESRSLAAEPLPASRAAHDTRKEAPAGFVEQPAR
jgi:hypothetical protein